MNDLWKYENGMWAWISGYPHTDTDHLSTTFLDKGYWSDTAFIGGRIPAAYWINGTDQLWIFGGLGADSGDGNYTMLP